jgi:hypothetical protein
MGIPLGIARTAPDWVYRPGPAPINPHGMPGWVPAGSRGQKPEGPRRVSRVGPVCRSVRDPQGTRVTVLAGSLTVTKSLPETIFSQLKTP